MTSNFLRLGCALAISLLAAPALAQQPPSGRPGRPYRGLFGGGVAASEQLLTVNASSGAGYDDDVLGEATGGTAFGSGSQSQRSTFGHFAGTLNYSLNRSRFNIGAGVSNATRYYPNLVKQYISAQSANLSEEIQITRGTRLTANQGVKYQPFYSFAFFPVLVEPQLGEVEEPRFDVTSMPVDYRNYTGSVELTQAISRRSSLIVNSAYGQTEFTTGLWDFKSISAGARYTHMLTKDVGLRVGYMHGESQYSSQGVVQRPQRRAVDAGVDMNRALSLTRRTTLGFTGGCALLVEVRDGTRDTTCRLTGRVQLVKEIGQTWNAWASYDRSADFVDTFDQPVMYDSFGVGSGGQINRRLGLQTRLGAALGQIGLAQTTNRFDTYFASGGLTVGITRMLGASIDYSYYRYLFDSATFLPEAFAPKTNRQSVRAYLSVWYPLLQRTGTRRRNASR